MMTLEELEKKLTVLDDFRLELKTQIAELKAQKEEKPTPPHPRWKPENGEMYRFIDDSENVAALHWSGDQFDLRHFDVGNMFKMNDDAAFAIERLKVLAQMREWAGKWNDSWRIVYTPPFIVPMSVALKNCSAGELRFATQEDAEGCIKAVGKDRLIKYYFGVRDHEIPAETE